MSFEGVFPALKIGLLHHGKHWSFMLSHREGSEGIKFLQKSRKANCKGIELDLAGQSGHVS